MSSTLEVKIEQVSSTTSQVTARSHSLFVDRPTARGGEDRGPVGGEYMLIGVGGCFTSHLLAAIRAREAKVTDVKVAVSGTLDGFPERFTAVRVHVSATCNEPGLLQKLTTVAERSCQVMNTLRDAVPITFDVQQAAPTAV